MNVEGKYVQGCNLYIHDEVSVIASRLCLWKRKCNSRVLFKEHSLYTINDGIC